jgi:Formyl transferase
MLTAYPGRIINVHHSDLLDRNAAGVPRFAGLRAVRDALAAGVHETRATAHLVTAGLDQGPPLVRSWAFPVAPLVRPALKWGATDILKAYAYAHQEWMIRATWGPLVDATLSMVADGRLDLATIFDALGNRSVRPFELDEDGRISAGSMDDVASAALMAMVG